MTTSPRVPMLSLESSKAAAETVGVNEAYAELSIFRTLLQTPRYAKDLAEMLTDLLFRSSLDTRLRELVIMRLGWTTGSVYEWTQHWRIALQLGVPEEDLLATRDGPSSPRWGDAERSVLQATDDVVRNGYVSEEAWAALDSVLPTVEERIELIASIGLWRMVGSILRSLDIPLEAGVEPWPPDGAEPPGG